MRQTTPLSANGAARPKLLNLNSYHHRRGGADVVYLDHAALFASQGWDTAFFAMHHPQNEPSVWSPYFVDELQYGASYGALQKVQMAGKIIYSVEARQKLAALLKVFRPDVAHAHNLYHHLSPSVLSLLHAEGIPTVMTAHDLKLACPSHEMLLHGRICERCKGGHFIHCVTNQCIKQSTALSALVALESAVHRMAGSYIKHLGRIIVPSRFLGTKLVEWGVPQALIHYLPNAVDVRAFQPAMLPGQGFAYIGRMTASKGVVTLIEAAKRTGLPLQMVGSGELDDNLRAQASGHPNIQFAGRLRGAALWQAVVGCRALVLPSEWYENAPMSILEAYALGRPVIGACIGGIPEMIDPGETGFLFEPGNMDALAAEMERVAALPDTQLQRLGAAARQRVVRDYSNQTYLANMLALYASLGVRGAAAHATGPAPTRTGRP